MLVEIIGSFSFRDYLRVVVFNDFKGDIICIECLFLSDRSFANLLAKFMSSNFVKIELVEPFLIIPLDSYYCC